ncbi:MAG: class I SAM-dependent methyltransferase [Candidatus Nanohaloarchaea archaeon]|nr:class I SAM-dependent methyltransferase [Candidatus Nanohaloarchaea archaeon]
MADDAFGHMVWDHYQGRPSFEAVEMDTGYLTAISPGPEWYFDAYEDWPDREQEVVDTAEGTVLDLGCGAGRHSLYLQRQGHEVLAVDTSGYALKTAEARGVARTRRLDLHDVDQLETEFDTVLMLGNNFGLVGGEEDARRFLAQLETVTSDDTRLIAEAEPCNEPEADRHHTTEEGNHYIRMRYRYKQFTGGFHRILYLSQEGLARLLEPTAWCVSTIFEEEDAATYIAVIVKEGDGK